MTFIASIIFAIGYVWIFWALYVLTMGLYRAQLNGRLSGVQFVMGLPFVILGIALDVIFNFTIASIMFAELPNELLVTERLKRHDLTGYGWRCSLARWICRNMLDSLDPYGSHC